MARLLDYEAMDLSEEDRKDIEKHRRAERWVFFLFGMIVMYAIVGLWQCLTRGVGDSSVDSED